MFIKASDILDFVQDMHNKIKEEQDQIKLGSSATSLTEFSYCQGQRDTLIVLLDFLKEKI
jgi:hypothetical protein